MTFTRTGVGHGILFAHGRIAVLQQLLLDRSDVDRLLGSHDVAEFGRILTELKLTGRIDQGIGDPDQILSAVAKWMYEDVMTMCPENLSSVFDILWVANDIPLLSFLLKEHLHLTSAVCERPLPPITAYEPSAWEALIREGSSTLLPASAVSCVRSILADPSMTPETIDAAVSRWGAEHQFMLAKHSGSHGILTLVRHDIDLKNIRTALRSSDLSTEERASSLLAGGTVPHEKLLGTREDLLRAVESSGLGYGLAEALGRETGSRLPEQSFSAISASDIAALWNIPLSVEPLFAFAALTLSQLRLLRAMLIAKRAGFSPQETKEILPPFLPATHYTFN